MTLAFIALASSVDRFVSGHRARAGLGLGGFRIVDMLISNQPEVHVRAPPP